MIVYPGSSTVMEREFPVGSSGITAKAFDFNGLEIPVGNIVQVGNNWRATVAVPEGAPVCQPDDYYKFIWYNGSTTVELDFQVIGYDEGVQRPMPAGFGVENISFVDELFLPLGVNTNPGEIKCELLALSGDVVVANSLITVTIDDTNSPTDNSPGSVKVTASLNAGVPVPVGEYVSHWSFKYNGALSHDFRQAFIISTRMTSLLSSFRMYLDQSQLNRWLAHFQFTDVELVDCLYRGADRVNAHPPQATAYSPDNMPFSLQHALRYAALCEMLNRLYLAEGLSTFDYQGGSIQVTADRTQYIQTKMDELNSWLESNLTQVKTVTVTRGSIGHLSITLSQGGLNNNFRNRGYIPPTQFQLTRGQGWLFVK